MQLVLIGMNHKTAPLEIRERLQLSSGDVERALPELMGLAEIREAICLSTCNRVEVIAHVTDGEQAVAMAGKAGYAVLFMDMQMPRLNGLEATQQIRGMPGYLETPIIAMTANAFAEDRARCYSAGMNDYLIKPFDPDTLFVTLLKALDPRPTHR